MVLTIDNHNGQDEFVSLVESVDDFISAHSNRALPFGTTFYLYVSIIQ